MTSCTGSVRGGFGGNFKKKGSWVESCGPKKKGDFRLIGVALWRADGKASIERLCISLPYVEKPFNSKVIKSFVPELRSRQCFCVSGFQCSMYIYICYEHSMYISHIHVWLCYRCNLRQLQTHSECVCFHAVLIIAVLLSLSLSLSLSLPHLFLSLSLPSSLSFSLSPHLFLSLPPLSLSHPILSLSPHLFLSLTHTQTHKTITTFRIKEFIIFNK